MDALLAQWCDAPGQGPRRGRLLAGFAGARSAVQTAPTEADTAPRPPLPGGSGWGQQLLEKLITMADERSRPSRTAGDGRLRLTQRFPFATEQCQRWRALGIERGHPSWICSFRYLFPKEATCMR
jgi:hypothetical protein